MNATTQLENSFLLPPGRVVQGDLYEPNTEDMQGNPLTVKSGPNMGKSRVEYFFAYAIPKTPGVAAWWLEPWGAKILTLAQVWWPQGQTASDRFSWKIADGDDARPNPEANMRRNCDREGFPGHWVVRLSSGFATKIFEANGTPLLQPGLVKRGFWVEAFVVVNSNENAQKPGIYINHNMVFYRAPDKEILSGPDPRTVGAGRAALPAGVSAAPAATPGAPGMPGATPPMPGQAAPGMPSMPGATPPMPGHATPGMPMTPGATPPMPGAMPPMPGQPTPGVPSMPGATPPMPGHTAVTPNAAFLQPPGAGAPPVPPAAPSAPMPSVVCPLGAPAGHKMVNPNGPRYEAFRAQGWPDHAMIQSGHMVRL